MRSWWFLTLGMYLGLQTGLVLGDRSYAPAFTVAFGVNALLTWLIDRRLSRRRAGYKSVFGTRAGRAEVTSLDSTNVGAKSGQKDKPADADKA